MLDNVTILFYELRGCQNGTGFPFRVTVCTCMSSTVAVALYMIHGTGGPLCCILCIQFLLRTLFIDVCNSFTKNYII